MGSSRCGMMDPVNYLPGSQVPLAVYSARRGAVSPPNVPLLLFICYSPRLSLGRSLSNHIPHKHFLLKDTEPLISTAPERFRAGEQRAAAQTRPRLLISRSLRLTGNVSCHAFIPACPGSAKILKMHGNVYRARFHTGCRG